MSQIWLKLKESPSKWLLYAGILNGAGLLALYSITASSNQFFLSSRFVKQCLWLVPSFLGFVIFLAMPKRIIHRYAYIAFVLSFITLFLPFVTGPVRQTYRWITMGSLHFQPVEVFKWISVVALARYLSDHNLRLHKFRSVLIPIIIILIPTLGVFKQPDLGSAVILMSPVIPMLYWVGARPFHIFLVIAPLISLLTAFNYYTFTAWIIGIAFVLYKTKPSLFVGLTNFFANIFIGLLTPVFWNSLEYYQKKRVLILLNLTKDPQGAGYQVLQSQTAIGSGGLLGKGFGGGTQTHLKFIPEQDTDFIFSVIGEEFGFVGALIILTLFMVLILGLVNSAYKSSERFSSLILVGFATLILAHTFVNIAMTINLLPVKGLPLPFMSYGGSFLISCYAMLGLAMNVGVDSSD